MKMKFVINIIALLVLTIQIGFAQQSQTDLNKLDFVEISENWDSIKTDFKQKLSDSGFKENDMKYSKLRSRLSVMPLFFEINDYEKLNLTKSDWEKYNKIRKDFIDSLIKRYPDPSSAQIEKLTKENSELKEKNKIPPHQPEDSEQSKGFFGYLLENWILALIAILEFVFIILILKRWNRVLNKNEDLRDKISELKMQKQSSETQLRSLQNQKPKEIIKEKEVVKTVYVDRPAPEKEEKKIVYKYLSQLNSADGGYFKLVQDEYDSSCFYRMFNINDGTAKYEFYGDELRAIKKWSSILDSAAEYEGDTDSAKHIKNIVPGEIQYDSSAECWKIVKKAKLKLY